MRRSTADFTGASPVRGEALEISPAYETLTVRTSEDDLPGEAPAGPSGPT